MGDARVVREGFIKGGALFDAEGGEFWVGEIVVCDREVVIALGVADAVDYGF